MVGRAGYANGSGKDVGQKLLEMAPVVPRAIEKARRADEKLVAFVQERPVTSLCVAAFAGYLLGRVITRIG